MPVPQVSTTTIRERAAIGDRYKWDLRPICADWPAWEHRYRLVEEQVARFASLAGTLARGPADLLAVFRASDEIGQWLYRIWFFAALTYDEDQRDNAVNARRQQVQILLSRWSQARAWFNPELLAIPVEIVRGWMDHDAELAVYRFAIESLYHEREHILDQQGERLMSYAGRFDTVPYDTYAALTTADMQHPTIRLSNGEQVTLTYGQYRALMATSRRQEDRAAAYAAFHDAFRANLNTYAALYNGVLQRDWFQARARGYASTLEAALHGNNIPTSVVTTLISETRAGVEPLRRYHRLRRRVLGLEVYKPCDTFVPLMEVDARYGYDEVQAWIVESVAPLGPDYQQQVRRAFDEHWIDVYENAGKRSGAYSAPVYGTHPYMLLNYNGTLDAVFTLAHEMGHSMHTLLAHATQPFVYAGYTIFVAEVPSTLNEELFIDHMLERARSREERTLLLQHAIDGIVSTYYTQVLFADFELQAHRLVEQDRPVTADVLNGIYEALTRDYYGDAMAADERTPLTWARIPHFFSTPYYVYQYATCFASSASLMQQIRSDDPAEHAAAVERYLALLRAGGNDYPVAQLQKAGVDLTRPETVRAVVRQLDDLVTRLEAEL